MEKAIEIGQQIGYIKPPKGTIIEANEIHKFKPHEHAFYVLVLRESLLQPYLELQMVHIKRLN